MKRNTNNRNRQKAAILVQLLFIIFTVWSSAEMFILSGKGNMAVSRTVIFRYFTVDSNILCAVSSIFSIVLLIHSLQGREMTGTFRKAVMLFRFAGTAAVSVTMMTVLLFLGLLYGYPAMFAGWNLWLHLLGPLLAIISFIWLEAEGAFPERRHLIWSVLPVIVYGLVYLVMVVLIGKERGGWPDFYGFNIGGRWYVSYLLMIVGTLLIGVVLMKLRQAAATFRSGI